METLSPNQLEEFFDIFENYNNSGQSYYRGQADYEWTIVPGIARNKDLTKDIELLKKVESKIIFLFNQRIEGNELSKAIASHSKSGYHHTWNFLMAAQHYGLPTRLLDFTNDKFSALEFAVADLNHLDKDGALIIYNDINNAKEEVGSSILKSPFNNQIEKTFFIQPISFYKNENTQLSERRKLIQGSKFLYRDSLNIQMCLSLEPEHSNHIVKVQIPSKLKPKLIEYLIKQEKMAYDLYVGKDENDFYAAIIKQEFKELKQKNITIYLGG